VKPPATGTADINIAGNLDHSFSVSVKRDLI